MTVPENKLLRRTFAFRNGEVIGSWGKLHNVEFQYLSSPKMIGLIKSKINWQ
jgi:hypothetical protein